jgi:hypothetical protein
MSVIPEIATVDGKQFGGVTQQMLQKYWGSATHWEISMSVALRDGSKEQIQHTVEVTNPFISKFTDDPKQPITIHYSNFNEQDQSYTVTSVRAVGEKQCREAFNHIIKEAHTGGKEIDMPIHPLWGWVRQTDGTYEELPNRIKPEEILVPFDEALKSYNEKYAKGQKILNPEGSRKKEQVGTNVKELYKEVQEWMDLSMRLAYPKNEVQLEKTKKQYQAFKIKFDTRIRVALQKQGKQTLQNKPTNYSLQKALSSMQSQIDASSMGSNTSMVTGPIKQKSPQGQERT